MLHKVRALFHQAQEPAVANLPASRAPNGREKGYAIDASGAMLRHSNGLREFLRSLEKSEELRVLDLGATSSANLTFFTERGHSVHSDDLLFEASRPEYQIQGDAAADAGPDVALRFDADGFMRANLQFQAARFDAVLLWDIVDYMPEALVLPFLQRLTLALKPGGTILSYFHTRDAGPEVIFYRYHIHDEETLQLRPGPQRKLQRIFNNRHVENLFRGYHSVKFFLSRDNLREVLATR